MGILNITPDSFSDGGAHLAPAAAIEAAMGMIADGAAVIDIGGESTRPGAETVGQSTELERILPVIEGIRRRDDIPISIDTMKESVASAALDAGADMINDVTALRHDEQMMPLVRRCGVPVILMHMRGEPRTMQQHAHYDDVVADVAGELAAWVGHARAAGVRADQILIDPGIGFAKTFEQNVTLLARCRELGEIAPVVIGASRKAFIGHLTGRAVARDRLSGSLATVAAAYDGGAAMVRVHDVRETVDFLRVLDAIRRA